MLLSSGQVWVKAINVLKFWSLNGMQQIAVAVDVVVAGVRLQDALANDLHSFTRTLLTYNKWEANNNMLKHKRGWNAMSWSSLVEGVILSDPRGLRFEPGHQQHFIKNIVLVPNVLKRREKKPWMAIFKTNLNFTFHWILSRIDLCRIFCKQFLCSLSLSLEEFSKQFLGHDFA